MFLRSAVKTMMPVCLIIAGTDINSTLMIYVKKYTRYLNRIKYLTTKI